MIKKTVILGLRVCSFLVSSTISAVAAEGVIDDELDDVEDENFELVSDAPNFDIDKLTYERNGQSVTLKLTLNEKGVIENKGNLEIFKILFDNEYAQELEERLPEMTEEEFEEYINMISEPCIYYWLILKTKENEYNLSYVNEEYIIKDLYSTELVQGDVDVDGNDLTFSFDLIDSGDRLVNLSATAMELVGMLEMVVYSDSVEGDCVDAAASGSGGDSSKTPGFEMIAVIVAIAIAFIILRRKK